MRATGPSARAVRPALPAPSARPRLARGGVHPSTVVPRSPPAAIAPPTADARTPQPLPPSPATGADPQAYRPAYTKAWWPVAAVDNLDPAVPNPIELMGEKLVAWKPSADAPWVVQADRCPHRAAPLTDGFVSKSGNLVCAYHGYTFGACGACTSIPSLAADPKAEATARASKRACVRTLPTTEAAGLLFVWPDPTSPSAAADAAAAPPPPVPAVVADESILPLKNRWYARHLPFDLSFHLENVLDPAHAVYAHHGVAGMDATKAPAFTLEVSDDRGAAGFTLRQRMADPSRRASFIHFDAPSLVRYHPDPDSGAAPPPSGTKTEARPGDPSGKLDTHLIFYAAPVRPGWTLLLGCSAIVDRETGAPSKLASIFGDALPAWLRHVLGHSFLAGDALSLSRASAAYAQEGRNWRSSYWMPSSADVGIVALRKWMDNYGGGPDVPALPPSAAGVGVIAPAQNTLAVTASEAALAGAPAEVLLDRYEQHVKHCAACSNALANTRTIASRARAFALAAAAAALVLTTAAAQAALTTAGAGAAVGWAPRAAAALVRATRGAPLAAVAACVVAATIAAFVVKAARALERQFLYAPFDREKHKFA